MKTRRFFWGNALPQALMAAARYHALPPEELAYRIYDKRHGFVNKVRRMIIEVDPAAPRRERGVPQEKAAPARPPAPRAQPSVAPQRAANLPSAPALSAPTSRPEGPARPSAARPRPEGHGHLEPFLPPDEESELAAAVAMGRLLAFAGLELEVRVERQAERLLVALSGQDEERLRELGEEFLDDLEHLLPRAIRGLAGRMVRCKVDGAGLRIAREDELRKLAEDVADRVAASGEAVLLDPLSAADRRIVHLALADDPRVRTESEGFGAEKRVRVTPDGAAPR
jgi:spoIIIJ-associated protein